MHFYPISSIAFIQSSVIVFFYIYTESSFWIHIPSISHPYPPISTQGLSTESRKRSLHADTEATGADSAEPEAKRSRGAGGASEGIGHDGLWMIMMGQVIG